ncbi:MAG TPA: TolC family outer membrane protein [Dongiaceae bacterium]|nr:TolC family outer membrane protein [Dongiaceae bacterium]
MTTAHATELEDALAQAYLNNPTLQAARAQLRQTDESVPQALSGWRPTVIGSVQGGYNRITPDNALSRQLLERQNAVDSARQSGFGARGGSLTTTPNSYGVTVSQPIFQGFKTVAGTRAAEKAVLAGRAQLEATEQTVLLQAVTAYMNVVRDQEVVEVDRRNVEVLQQQLDYTRARFDAGLATRTDVSEAESRLARSVGEKIAAEGQLTLSRAQYQQVIGQMPDQVHAPKLSLSLPQNESAAAALADQRPELVAARHSAESAQENIDVAFGDLLPSLSIEGSYSRVADQRTRGTVEDEATVMGVLSVPLYQAGAPDSRVRQAKQRYSELLERIEETRRQSVQQAIDAWRQYRAASASVESDRKQLESAQLALEGVIEEQKVGQRTVLDIFDAEQEVRNAQVALVTDQANVVIAAYYLQQTAGRLTAKQLALKVPLYDPTKYYDKVRNKFWGWDTE